MLPHSVYGVGSQLFSNFPLKIHPITSVLYLFALIFVPHFVKRDAVVRKLKKTSKPYTIATSRISSAAAADNTPDGIFISKCLSCHQNFWEAFTYYSVTIAFCMIANLPSQVVKGFAGYFLVNRVLYLFVYLSNLNGPLRSLVWFGGLFPVLFMLFFAAHSTENLW